jgi:hypothetical protein
MKTKMKVAQISKAGGDFELVERDIPEPGARKGKPAGSATAMCS